MGDQGIRRETIGAGGVVESFDWLDYGSYSTLPTSPMVLSSVVTQTNYPPGGTGFQIAPVQWTRGPLATTIDWVQTDSNPNLTDIFVSENFATNPSPYNAFPTTMPVQYFYYGDDDGPTFNSMGMSINTGINNALKSQSAASIATGNGAAFSLPGACGTTVPINLPQDTSGNVVNPSLVGGNFQSTGLYAFAQPLANRGATTSTTTVANIPVLNRVVYGGLANAIGGGIRDMQVEAMGIPEGFGYYGLAEGVSPPGPTGAYIGPTPPSQGMLIPTAGDAVEIDSGTSMRIDNVHITDGGIGPGNAVFQCGIDESDPTMTVRNAATAVTGNAVSGNIVFTDSRLDGNQTFSGATNPDISLRLANSCHSSVYRALSVYDGAKADVLDYNANLLSQIHLNSDAANSSTGLADPSLTFGANFRFAGVADYGVYVIGNTAISQTQCDIANFACVHVVGGTGGVVYSPGQITDTQMKCGSLQSVPPTYYGVELGAGVVDTTVSGTASSGKCSVPPSQLVVLDSTPIDQTVSLCNNSNAPVVYCAGYPGQSGFTPGRYYTQPSLGYATVLLPGAGSGNPTTIYAIPFINQTGGMITQMGIQVTTTGTAKSCLLGLYSSVNGAPGALLLAPGSLSVTSAGKLTVPGLSYLILPNTLYFLAVSCNGAVTVQGTTNTSGPISLVMGEPDFVSFGGVATGNGTNITATATLFPTPGVLPATFGPATYGASATLATMPNIYVGP